MNFQQMKPNGFFIKTAFLLLFTLASLSQAAAQDKKVELSSRKITLERAFIEIERQTGIIVAINHTALDVKRQVTVPSVSGSVREILDALLVGTGQTYELKNNYAILRNVEPHEINVAEIKAEQSIFGYVQALNNAVSLDNAKVTLSGPVQREVFTDSHGKYLFDNIPAGTYTVTATYDNYASQEIQQSVGKSENARMMFLLAPVYAEDHRTWTASFAYPEYENQPKLKGDDFSPYIAPYQEQRLPRLAIKTNLLYYGALMTNLGVEFRVGRSLSVDLPVVYKPFEINTDGMKEFRILNIQPELRYWITEPFNGHFFGAHLSYTQFKIGGHKLPLDIFPEIKDNRYEGDSYGLGISYGYQMMLGKRFGLEFTFAAGYAYADYKRYTCESCSRFTDKGSKHYFGPTKAGITLVYVIK